ncbi:MAG: hypothetical protein KAJ03_10065 [Gammaproteobacteria bacterium]|nr:hypothetical protein [Gammaproteobacteria bacterium]
MASENFVTYDPTLVKITVGSVEILDIAPQHMGGTTGLVPHPADMGGNIYVDIKGEPIARSPSKPDRYIRAGGAISVYAGSDSIGYLIGLAKNRVAGQDEGVMVKFTAVGAGIGFDNVVLSNCNFDMPVVVITDSEPIHTFNFDGWDYLYTTETK